MCQHTEDVQLAWDRSKRFAGIAGQLIRIDERKPCHVFIPRYFGPHPGNIPYTAGIEKLKQLIANFIDHRSPVAGVCPILNSEAPLSDATINVATQRMLNPSAQ